MAIPDTELRELRLYLHLPLRAAAEAAGISHACLYNAEKGINEMGNQKRSRVISYYKSKLAEKRKLDGNNAL